MTRLPTSVFNKSHTSASPAPSTAQSGGASPKTPSAKKSYGMPRSGCYLCAATDHYCNDRSHHALDANGKYKKVSADAQKAIMLRIDRATSSGEWKAAEKKRVREFWARRCAP